VRDPYHPCRECAYYLPPVPGDPERMFSMCIHPRRIKQAYGKWTTPNRRGEKCTWFDKGEQLQLTGGEI